MFDFVLHQSLFGKLVAYSVQGKLLTWIGTFLTGRHQRVVFSGDKYEWNVINMVKIDILSSMISYCTRPTKHIKDRKRSEIIKSITIYNIHEWPLISCDHCNEDICRWHCDGCSYQPLITGGEEPCLRCTRSWLVPCTFSLTQYSAKKLPLTVPHVTATQPLSMPPNEIKRPCFNIRVMANWIGVPIFDVTIINEFKATLDWLRMREQYSNL